MDLLYYPDPKLRERAEPVEDGEDLTEIIQEMFRVMYAARGIGLAAPQAGLGKRLIVANMAGNQEQADQEEVYINPEIVDRSKDVVKEEEACLSLPGLSAELSRPREVTVRYTDLKGRSVTRTVEGMQARLFLHEIDHLDGILLLDLLTPADKARWAPALREMELDFKAKKPRSYSPTRAGL
jgi:peptide deformylase